MHRTVPVECLGGNYCRFILFKKNEMCICREEIYSRYAAVSIQSSCIRLN